MDFPAKAAAVVEEQNSRPADIYTPAVLELVHKAIDLVHSKAADQKVQILRRRDDSNGIAAEAHPAASQYGPVVHWCYDQDSDHLASDFFAVFALQDWRSLSCSTSMAVF